MQARFRCWRRARHGRRRRRPKARQPLRRRRGASGRPCCRQRPLAPQPARAACNNPNALGVGRTVEIDTTGGPGFGFEHFKQLDFLRDKEVVLTFDDGPWPGNTPAVLKALADECTTGIFFSIGKHATYYPEILKQVYAAGHTVGTHTWSHATLTNKKLTDLAMLRALTTEGAVRELAEPNIIAMDGQEASFLAGGEFPIPVVQSDGIAHGRDDRVQRIWRAPEIQTDDYRRRSHPSRTEPEVSTIDFANGVKFDGFVIPGLSTRRAKTGVELRDGQSFALAGLLDNREIKTMSEVPLLSQIPILGNLFKSKSFQKNETELMFIITAQVVKPVNRDDIPQFRGIDGLKKGSPLGIEPKGEGIQGPTGFSITGQKSQAAPVVTPKVPIAPATQLSQRRSATDASTATSTVTSANVKRPPTRRLRLRRRVINDAPRTSETINNWSPRKLVEGKMKTLGAKQTKRRTRFDTGRVSHWNAFVASCGWHGSGYQPLVSRQE